MVKKTTDVPPTPKKVTKTTKSAPKAAAPVEPVVEVAAPAEPSENTVVPVESDKVLLQDFQSFFTRLQGLASEFASLRKEFAVLEKATSRELKAAKKASGKRKAKSGNRSPSGFIKPTLVSDELATFLGKAKGTEMARTDVTREINKYIRANNLQDKDNGRKIIPDSKLAKLLKLQKTDELTYFNLQRYMSPHFPKSSKAVAAAAAASA